MSQKQKISLKKYSDSKEELINDVEIYLKKGENNEKPGLNKIIIKIKIITLKIKLYLIQIKFKIN